MVQADTAGIDLVGRANDEEAALAGSEILSVSVDEGSRARDQSPAEQRVRRNDESIVSSDVIVDSRIVREETLD